MAEQSTDGSWFNSLPNDDDCKYLLELKFSDGCIFIIDTLNVKDREGWEIVMPGGLQVKCPHGIMFNSDLEPPGTAIHQDG